MSSAACVVFLWVVESNGTFILQMLVTLMQKVFFTVHSNYGDTLSLIITIFWHHMQHLGTSSTQRNYSVKVLIQNTTSVSRHHYVAEHGLDTLVATVCESKVVNQLLLWTDVAVHEENALILQQN